MSMNATEIILETPDSTYTIVVAHECTCGQFRKDIKRG